MSKSIGLYWPDELEEEAQEILTSLKRMAKERFGIVGVSRLLAAINSGELELKQAETGDLATDIAAILDKHKS